MEDYQQRVVKEKEELDEKLSKLTLFLQSDATYHLPRVHLDLLFSQKDAMEEYSDVLRQRITLFKGQE